MKSSAQCSRPSLGVLRETTAEVTIQLTHTAQNELGCVTNLHLTCTSQKTDVASEVLAACKTSASTLSLRYTHTLSLSLFLSPGPQACSKTDASCSSVEPFGSSLFVASSVGRRHPLSFCMRQFQMASTGATHGALASQELLEEHDLRTSSAPAPASWEATLTRSPSPSPWLSPTATVVAAQAAQAFVNVLSELRNRKPTVLDLQNNLRRMAKSPNLSITMAGASLCTRFMANHAAENRHLSWEGIGFKDASHNGYDVTNRGLSIIDYGNHEYMNILEFIVLRRPDVQIHLNCLYHVWPTIDLWASYKSNDSIERLADIVECIMAAFRGHSFFEGVIQESHKVMFSELISLCRLYHVLVAMLETGVVKFNRFGLAVVPELRTSEFGKQWIAMTHGGRGVLLHNLLLLAAVQ